MKDGAARPLLLSTLFAGALLLSSCHAQVAKAPAAPPPASKPDAPTITLQATPTNINRGQSSTLTWLSSNATQVTLAPGVGGVVEQGSRRVTPNDSTTYTVTATGPGGTATATASIGVSVPYTPPAAAGLSPAELFQKNVKDSFFDYDKSDIRGDAKEALTGDADFLHSHPDIKFTVEGHCDERGGEEYNLALGDRRASSTKQYLVSLGIPADHIQTTSLGKEHPFCTTETEACYQQNRRGHFVMTQ